MINEQVKALRAAEAKAAAYARSQNEGGGGYNPYQAEVDAALDAVTKADADAFVAEWTAEVYAARRDAWNAEVVKHTGRAVSATLITQIERATGLKIVDLRRAKQIHG